MTNSLPQGLRKRIEQIRRRITGMDYVCAGTLLKRTKVCGKPGCRCARDPAARHGPYYEWSRLEGGRLVHTVLSAPQARDVARAIRNHRTIQRLLTVWQRESIRAIRGAERHKPGR